MEQPQQITINEPVTLTLEPLEVTVILDALSELPLKKSNGVFQKIINTIVTQNREKQLLSAVPPSPPQGAPNVGPNSSH